MESELKWIVDAIPVLVWTAQADGRVDFVNQRWCKYTGHSLDAASGEGWQTAIHPEDLLEARARWHAGLASRESFEMEVRLRSVDGEYRWFLFRTGPLAGEAGHVEWCGVGTDVHDRRQGQELEYESERSFRSIIDGLPTHVAVSTAECELEDANRQYLEYFGATLEELKARGTVHSCHPDDRPLVLAARAKALEVGRPYEIEVRRLRGDGVYRWFQMRHFPLRDAKGQVILWYLLQTDVEDRKRAEALLAGENRVLELIATGESLSVTLSELCLLVEELCPACVSCSILSLDPKSKRLWHLASPNVPKAYTGAIDGFAIGPEVSSCGTAAYTGKQVIASDIATDSRWSEFRDIALANGLRACWSTPILSQQNSVLGTFALFSGEPRGPSATDQEVIAQVTHLAAIAIERIRAEDSLRRSEAYLSEAQALSRTGSFGWSVSGDQHFWSAETFRLFDYEPSTKVTLQLILDRAHPQDVHLVKQAIARAHDGHDFDYECRFVMPSSSVKHLHIVAHRRRTQDGNLEYIGAVQDVTEARLSDETLSRIRSELAQVARVSSLGALTASIAHEVSQPLSGIITNSGTCLRMLAASPPNVDGAIETARRTIRDGNRASDVITRLRALFGKKQGTRESVDLNEAALEVMALLLSDLQRNRVVLRAELAEGLPNVMGDRVQLQQVIVNLLRNASDAMSAVESRPRQLVIRTERDEEDCVRLTVQDSGVGLDPQTTDRLFDAFFTTKGSGMGIGLSVSRAIIESHNGRLWAASNGSLGASFAFSIPRRLENVPTVVSSNGGEAAAESVPGRLSQGQ
jgi:PAS domain S-box-containing protein